MHRIRHVHSNHPPQQGQPCNRGTHTQRASEDSQGSHAQYVVPACPFLFRPSSRSTSCNMRLHSQTSKPACPHTTTREHKLHPPTAVSTLSEHACADSHRAMAHALSRWTTRTTRGPARTHAVPAARSVRGARLALPVPPVVGGRVGGCASGARHTAVANADHAPLLVRELRDQGSGANVCELLCCYVCGALRLWGGFLSWGFLPS